MYQNYARPFRHADTLKTLKHLKFVHTLTISIQSLTLLQPFYGLVCMSEGTNNLFRLGIIVRPQDCQKAE